METNEAPEIERDELLRQQYEALGHEGLGFTEIRIPKKGVQLFVEGREEFVKAALSYCNGDVYVGVNPRKEKKGGAEAIEKVTCIVFDFDPIRPKGQGSSSEQLEESIAGAKRLRDECDGLLVSSGSGAHVYVPIHPLGIDSPEKITSALAALAKRVQDKYNTPTVRVDSTFDLPRIIRCWGTFNDKSKRWCYKISGDPKKRIKFDPAKYYPAQVKADTLKSVPHSSKLQRIINTNPRVKGIMDGTSRYPSRSEADFALASSLFKLGMTQDEVLVALMASPLGKAKERSQRDLEAEIKRIQAKVAGEIPKPTGVITADEYMRDLDSRNMGIPTGMQRLDYKMSGLRGSRLYVIGARPGEGKTTLMAQMALNVAETGSKVLFFPTELARMSLIDKLVSSRTGINAQKLLYKNKLSEIERGMILGEMKEIEKLPISIVENFGLRLEDVQRAARANRPDVLFVDFLQRMYYRDNNSSSELAANVVGLNNLGKELDIPVVLASQLHRKMNNTPDSMADLKGTGKLEEEADVIIFVRTMDEKSIPMRSRATIMKNRYGQTGEIGMNFYSETCRFQEDE